MMGVSPYGNWYSQRYWCTGKNYFDIDFKKSKTAKAKIGLLWVYTKPFSFQGEVVSDNLEQANVLSKLTTMLKSTQEKLKEKVRLGLFFFFFFFFSRF